MGKSTKAGKRWSGEVTRHSDALDLEEGIFTKASPREIALSLKRSAEHSKRRKGTPYQSAMSMLTFEINRAGKKPFAGTARDPGKSQGRAAQGVRPRLRQQCRFGGLARALVGEGGVCYMTARWPARRQLKRSWRNW